MGCDVRWYIAAHPVDLLDGRPVDLLDETERQTSEKAEKRWRRLEQENGALAWREEEEEEEDGEHFNCIKCSSMCGAMHV
jgi:hypothetical protein